MRQILFILTISTTLFAGPDWFGYYEGEYDFGKLPDKSMYFSYNKLRLDMDSSPSDNIRISADIIYKQFNGQTELNFMDFINQQYWPVFPTEDGKGLDTLSNLPYCFSDTLFIDNMFLEFHHKLFDLTLGKQQIAPGVGYAWNPTDIFNLKDIMDPTYENTGISAIKLGIPLAGRTTLSGILQPKQSWDETTQYYQLKTGIGHYDLSALYGRSQLIQNKLFGKTTQARDLYGFNLEGELFGVGIRSEAAVHRLDYENDNLQYEYVIGADYTFANSLFIMAEYYHSDLGSPADKTVFDDYLVYFAGERKSLNQNYLFNLVMYPLGDLLDAGVLSIINLDDKSAVVIPQLIYRIYQDVELGVMGSLFIGEDTDEFGYQEYGARVRLRAYF
ncbi:MAG: hypothetical protein H8D42_01075 [Candidatus Marinimicrobia bacterium]|nr:hypothetical protein [Candidatus Neomarinimicrobiota bacterium]MBL7068161.1 hypothetical protein [Candidatus Neomarinimicrobiota bacterium]